MVILWPRLWCCEGVVFSVTKMQRMVIQIGTHQDSPQLRDQLWVDLWLQWRHMNILRGVSNCQPLDNFKAYVSQHQRKHQNFALLTILEGNPVVTDGSVTAGFPHKDVNAEKVPKFWSPHVTCGSVGPLTGLQVKQIYSLSILQMLRSKSECFCNIRTCFD